MPLSSSKYACGSREGWVAFVRHHVNGEKAIQCAGTYRGQMLADVLVELPVEEHAHDFLLREIQKRMGLREWGKKGWL
jgi:hypothetical protein